MWKIYFMHNDIIVNSTADFYTNSWTHTAMWIGTYVSIMDIQDMHYIITNCGIIHLVQEHSDKWE